MLPDIGYVELEKATEYRLRKSFADLPQNISASSRTTPRPTTTTTTPTTIVNSGEMLSAHVKHQPFSPQESDRNTHKISFSGPVYNLWQQPGPDKISDTIMAEPARTSQISSQPAQPPISQANTFAEPTGSHTTLKSTSDGSTDAHITQTSTDIGPSEAQKTQTIPFIESSGQPSAQTTTFVEPTEQPKPQTTLFVELTEQPNPQTTAFVELTDQPNARTTAFVELTEQPNARTTRFIDPTEAHTSQNIHKQSRKSARELPTTRGQHRAFKNIVLHPFFDAGKKSLHGNFIWHL